MKDSAVRIIVTLLLCLKACECNFWKDRDLDLGRIPSAEVIIRVALAAAVRRLHDTAIHRDCG